MSTASEQLAAAIKAAEDATAKVEALKAESRKEDLATVKLLIERHAFKIPDLRPELKTTRATTGKKAVATKSGARKKAR